MKLNINDDQELELLHFIFERELKPPFRLGKKDVLDNYAIYNVNDERIGWIDYRGNVFCDTRYWEDIRLKVCRAFGFLTNLGDWEELVQPQLKYWMASQLNLKLKNLY